MNNKTYLTTDELSERIKYDSRTIRERLKDSVLLEGIHYFRPFGGRKILYIWETIERDMQLAAPTAASPWQTEMCAMASIQVRKETGCLIWTSTFKASAAGNKPLTDTAANRKKVQKVLDRIEADIAAGTFDYRRYFPASKNAAASTPHRRSALP
jgi:hypothetical protein